MYSALSCASVYFYVCVFVHVLQTKADLLQEHNSLLHAQDFAPIPIFGNLFHVKNEWVEPESVEDRAELSLPPGLLIAESGVDDDFIGLWTDSFIPSRTLFGPLEGVVVSLANIGKLDQYYLWKIQVNATSYHYLNVKRQSRSSWLRYPAFALEPHQQNLVQIVLNGQLYFYTSKSVEAVSELSVAVDAEHMERLGQNTNTWSLNPLLDESRWPFFYACPRGNCANVLRQCYAREDNTVTSQCPSCYSFETEDCPFTGDLHVVRNFQVSADGYTADRDIKTLPPGVSIRNSTIKGAGLGAFADEYFPSRTRFGPYDGFIVRDTYNKHRDIEYTWIIYENDTPLQYIDAIEYSTSSWLRYINTANTKELQNLIAIQCDYEVYYYSYRPIKAGDELLVWYGPEYDKYLGVKRPLVTGNPRHNESKWPFFYTCAKGNCVKNVSSASAVTVQYIII